MPSYTHNFIKNIVYSNNDNNAENKTVANEQERRTNRGGTEGKRNSREGTEGTAYTEGKGNTGINRAGVPQPCQPSRRAGTNLYSLQRRILQGKWRSQGIESRLIELNFKYPNLFYYLILIDSAFTDIALVINLTNIQTIIKSLGVY